MKKENIAGNLTVENSGAAIEMYGASTARFLNLSITDCANGIIMSDRASIDLGNAKIERVQGTAIRIFEDDKTADDLKKKLEALSPVQITEIQAAVVELARDEDAGKASRRISPISNEIATTILNYATTAATAITIVQYLGQFLPK